MGTCRPWDVSAPNKVCVDRMRVSPTVSESFFAQCVANSAQIFLWCFSLLPGEKITTAIRKLVRTHHVSSDIVNAATGLMYSILVTPQYHTYCICQKTEAHRVARLRTAKYGMGYTYTKNIHCLFKIFI